MTWSYEAEVKPTVRRSIDALDPEEHREETNG
jgi:hypothetical protein